MWTETIVALLFVLARLYTRVRIVRNIGWDDHLISISMFLFLGYTILITIAATDGFGSHLTDLGLPQAVKAIKWEIAGQTFNIAAIGTSKSSVAVFLLRIVTSKSHIWILWFCIASTSFVCASCIVFMYTQCTPLESIFNPTLPHVCYLNFTVNAIFSGSYTAAMDFVLAIFPWFVLWKLNMKRKERLTIALGLSLGVFAGICGVIRAVELQGISGKADYTYLTLPLILWGSTELLICIVCASVPILRPLYKQVRGVHSSNTPYELGNTPSRQLDTGGKDFESTAKASREGIVTRAEGNTTMFMGGTQYNSSDEEILQGVFPPQRMHISLQCASPQPLSVRQRNLPVTFTHQPHFDSFAKNGAASKVPF
ncbi:uncharacterized protein LY89DRAFT_711067 [Mollisia scopiformis]|uniref:Rhodopsin domain-containing protein n=1 Tax=Mollisia scopiformis TaxID=149040 RepID=A0A132BBN2_MOLSC|nr:uncharacterized protein LY89DRAFT_711067 [Mollisia scopiformis]KUJ09791.1 hypothetical protein LY89DRAFT_711067 [Mollisia scopiformis]